MFRLINLALALAASVNVILTPSRFLSALFVSDEAARGLDPFVNFLVETGINMLLPAAAFLVCFCAAGLHKKAHGDMPPPPVALKTTWVVYCGFWSLPHILSSNEKLALGYSIAFGGWLFVLIAGFAYIVWVAASIARELGGFKRAAEAPNGVEVKPSRVVGVAISLVLVTIAILWLSPGAPIHASAMDTSLYESLCSDVGVRLLDKPMAPVKSIAYDYGQKQISGWSNVTRIELDRRGRILGTGGFSTPNSIEATKTPSFDFTERRAGDGAGAATINPSAPYYRFPNRESRQSYHGVDHIGADVVALVDVDKPDELRKAPVYQRAVRYQITLTDQRSKAVIGKQVFVVDRLNKRACGANIENVISPSAFIFDAINR